MNINELTVGLLGGTGPEGKGLALRWATSGARVMIGSRSAERAREAAADLNGVLGRDAIRFGENSDAARSDFLILAIPFEHATALLESVQEAIPAGSILIDATVPVVFDKGAKYAAPPEGSGSLHLRARLRAEVPLVATFKTMPAHLLEDYSEALDCDEFVAGDTAEARARVIEAIGFIPGLRGVDAGPLDNAGTLERMTVLAIGINRRHKIKTARFRVIGL